VFFLKEAQELSLEISAEYQHICSSPAAKASRRRGNDLSTTIKYLRKINAAPRASA
jgi:hypothetical protein